MLLLPPGHPELHQADEIRTTALAAFAPGCTNRMLAEEWLTSFGTQKADFAVQEVRSYHAMSDCPAAGSCISIMPRSVVDLMRHLGPVEEQPLMKVDTYLACRPGFDTPAFSEFRKTLAAFSDIADQGHEQ
nr:LysR substrate-binding domain-containing protein [Ensifer sp. NM-2]